jgi:uncharacterized membrane protein YphA (DoxX/SURF4 family)
MRSIMRSTWPCSIICMLFMIFFNFLVTSQWTEEDMNSLTHILSRKLSGERGDGDTSWRS